MHCQLIFFWLVAKKVPKKVALTQFLYFMSALPVVIIPGDGAPHPFVQLYIQLLITFSFLISEFMVFCTILPGPGWSEACRQVVNKPRWQGLLNLYFCWICTKALCSWNTALCKISTFKKCYLGTNWGGEHVLAGHIGGHFTGLPLGKPSPKKAEFYEKVS